jgi:TonB-linked SusC/RagA family outer membrane protein
MKQKVLFKLVGNRYLFLLICFFGYISNVSAQSYKITGVVVDQENIPLIGATIQVSGANNATTTDADGNFALEVRNPRTQLQISYIGFTSVTVPVQLNEKMVITMTENARNLDEVIIIGYGTVRKSDLSGSVSAISMNNEAETMPIVSADQFLQGRIAGVNISADHGAPGAGMRIQIRGTSTLSGNTAPLYVVDGFPIEAATASMGGNVNELSQQPVMNPLASINPNDIESIQILKDASATAIYGSRATNGVVLITTKQGKEGKVNVSYNFRLDISNIAKRYNLLNAYDYALYENEFDRTSNGYDMQGNVISSTKALRHTEDALERYKLYSTDWQQLMYQTAVSQDHQVVLNGGNQATQYNITAGYTDQEGIIMNTGLERYSFRLNLKTDLAKRLTLQVNTNYSQTEQKQTSHSQASSVNQMVRRIMTTKPTLMPGDVIYEDEDVTYVAADNPYVMATELKDNLKQQFFILNGAVVYNFGKGLSWKAAGSFNRVNGSRSAYYPIGTGAGNGAHGMAFRGEDKRQNMVLETTMNYNRKFKKIHHINAVLGYTHEDRQRNTLAIQVGDFVDNSLLYYAIGEGTNTMDKSSSVVLTKLSSFLGRINYTLYDRYIFTATGRYDGSSLLASGNRWSFFPSFAVAWRINQERFLKNIEAISNVKLRLSYGLTGNQNISYAAPLALMNHTRVYIGGEVTHGMGNGKLANSDLGWENTTTYNAGLDLGFVDNRFRFTMDAYQRVTKDMLMDFGLPLSSGYNTIPYNMGQITNKGLELEVSADILTGRVKWTLGGNIYLNRNKVDNLGGNELLGAIYLAGGGVFNQHIHITKAGYTVGSFYGYIVDGVYQNEAEAKLAPFDSPQATPGSLRFKDISGPDGLPDGKITSDDMTIIGTAEPKFNYGITSELTWKGLSLSMVFTGRVGGDIANLNRYFLDSYTDTNDNIRAEAWNGRWQGEGTSNFYPAVNAQGTSYFNKRFSTFLLEDGSFFRLKNLTLTYQFNLKKLPWLRSIRVFGSVTNVFTITNYSGYDPEVSISTGAMSPNVDYAAYPSSRTFSMGINLAF